MVLPVPVGTDPACEFSEDWCLTTAAINARIAAYEKALARAYPASPMALLRRTEPLFPNAVSQPISMTEATFDTAGMTDLDADPTIITIQQTGRYVVRAWLQMASTTVVNTIVDATINVYGPPTAFISGYALDRGSLTVAVSSFHPAPFSTGGTFIKGTKISLSTAHTISSTVPILAASLFAGWHADQENP
jgi:hypothetical protein